MNHEIFIRLLDDEIGFIYSVRHGAELIESAAVHPPDPQSPEAPLEGHCGGSMAMD